MAINYWMTFCITFRNHDEYLIAQAITGGENVMRITPQAAGILFGLGPNVASWPSGDVQHIDKFGWFTFPWGVGIELRFPGPTGVFLQENVLEYNVPCQPGTPASIWPCPGDGSHDAHFEWELSINFEGSYSNGDVVPPPAANPMPTRRWIGGGGNTQLNEGGTSAPSINAWTRDASRTIDGFGIALRGTGTNSWNKTTTEFRPGLNPPRSWERFYVRFRRLGAGAGPNFWRCHGSPSAGAGASLQWFNDGTVHAIDNTAFAVERDQGVVWTPVINQWYKIDIFLKYFQGAAEGGAFRLYLDGNFQFGYTVSDNNGLDGGNFHASSDLGGAATSANWEIDCCDWMCADLPANIDTVTLQEIDGNFPIDFFLGSHIRRYLIDPTTGSSTNWTGNRAAMNQGLGPSTQQSNQLVSTTALARMEAVADVPSLAISAQDPTYPILGIASAVVGLYSRNVGGTDGQIGYRKAGGGDTLVTADQLNSSPGTSTRMMYLPSGLNEPEEVAPFSVVHIKSNDANQDLTSNLTVTVEVLGMFGDEDGFALPVNRLGWFHNAPYPNSIYGMMMSPQAAPVYAVGGTYVGNGTRTRVLLPTAPHWIWIRALTGGTLGFKWWSSMINPHLAAQEQGIPTFWTGFDGLDYYFEVAGTSAEINANAVTFQYIAFCDPGGRFMLNTGFFHANGATTPVANPLWQPSFLPNWTWFVQESVDDNNVTNRVGSKGPGNTATQASLLTSGALANFGSFAAGVFNSLADCQNGIGQESISLFRHTEPGCAGTMVQILQYTGNGAGSQVVNLTPVSGRFPLFVLVQPTAGGNPAHFRDPSHTGSNSASATTLGNSITAITAVAIDQITVGSTLNTNLTVYNVFVICGDTAGMNNGAYTNLFCELPAGPQNNDPPFPSNEPNVVGDGGLVLNGSSPLTLLKDVSGIYTLILNKRNDTLIDRQTGQDSVDVEIPDPTFKTGYIGG